jgi:hypothetical protein
MAHSGTKIYMENVPEQPGLMMLSKPLPCRAFDGSDDFVPEGFQWNGNSTPPGLRWLFPKWNHPIASCKHDYRCGRAKNAEERAWADKEFENDVGTTSWWITKKLAYAGVRVGAFFGVGSNF